MAKTINDLNSSPTDFLINFNNTGDDSFNPSTNTINWDPNSALAVPGGSQTPALGLGHEMAHADENRWLNWILLHIVWPDYDNLEERRVIAGPECKAANKLGETPRTIHSGPQLTTFTVPSPTSR
jgi:hypothetical protein